MLTMRLIGLVALAVSLSGCATLKEIAALRQVDFAFDRISNVSLAGVRLDGLRSYSDLAPADVARLVGAVTSKDMPLDLIVHVRAENPKDNAVTARLIEMDWAFFVETRQALQGTLGGTHVLPPGTPVDLPIPVRFDALSFFSGGARDLVETALAVAGYSATPREVRLELEPSISTDLGPIAYPDKIVLKRSVGGR